MSVDKSKKHVGKITLNKVKFKLMIQKQKTTFVL